MADYPNLNKWEKKLKSVENQPVSKPKKFKFPPAAPKPKKAAAPKPIHIPLPKGVRTHTRRNKWLKEINEEHLHGVDFDEMLYEAGGASQYKETKSYYMTPEQFVNANYKFVVSPKMPDLKELFFSENASNFPEWDNVELVLCPLEGKYDCPICNEKGLIAPKITKCGHIFCAPCLLQYVHHQKLNNLPRKCPLCYAILDEEEAKSCKLTKSADLAEGAEIELHLTVRNKDSIIIRDTSRTNNSYIYSPEMTQFTRITVAPDFTSILESEVAQLEEALWTSAPEEELESAIFIEEALNRTKEKLASRKSMEPVPFVLEEGKEEESHYVYQISTGESVYLLPLDFKCLQDEFGAPEKMPKVLKAKVLEVQHQRFTGQLKKKYRFLDHLPLNSTLTFVEIDLTGILKQGTLLKHQESLMERQAARDNEKAAEEVLDKDKRIIDYLKENDKEHLYIPPENPQEEDKEVAERLQKIPNEDELLQDVENMSLQDTEYPHDNRAFLFDIDLAYIEQASKKKKKKRKVIKK